MISGFRVLQCTITNLNSDINIFLKFYLNNISLVNI